MSGSEVGPQARLMEEALAIRIMRTAAALLSHLRALCRVHKQLALLIGPLSFWQLSCLLHGIVELRPPTLGEAASFPPRQLGWGAALTDVADFHLVQPQKAPAHDGQDSLRTRVEL